METPISEQDIEYAETYLAAGDISTASQMLERYLELAEEYIAEECQATDEVQYFSFQDSFERLCYARVEHDPRRIVAVPAPFDRLYSDVAYVCIQQQDYERARDALVQAVRWNPMNCKYRLDLAEIFRALGDIQEWAALSNSVLERASDGRVAARAYSNLGQLFIDQDNAVAASGCARLAVRLAPADARTVALWTALPRSIPRLPRIPTTMLWANFRSRAFPRVLRPMLPFACSSVRPMLQRQGTAPGLPSIRHAQTGLLARRLAPR